jgi:site-specific DNA recombinase
VVSVCCPRRRRLNSEKERADLERQVARLVDAIADGTVSNVGAVGEKLRALEERLSGLLVVEQEPAPVDWHPNAGELYKRRIADLSASLNADPIVRDEATAALRSLIDKIVAYPAKRRGQFDLELHGHLAEALNMAMHDNIGGERGRQPTHS